MVLLPITIATILELSTKLVKEMAGYYRKFCHNFSTITKPLMALLKKGNKFHWSSKCNSAFEKISAFWSRFKST